MTGKGLTSRKFWREHEQEPVGLLEAGDREGEFKMFARKNGF